jgi:AcrR family transcriptional regulator
MEKEMTTKQKIIFESLRLFSQKGYDGVSMREIAAAVGIKGASIYNHFSGKEEIFHAIFDEMKKLYDNSAMAMNIPVEQNQKTVEVYLNLKEADLLQFAEGLFSFFCKDEFVAMFRKLLVCEQYKFPMAAELLKQYYIDAPIFFQTQLFEGMQKHGVMKDFDAGVMALHFYGPTYYILCRFDLGYPYEECLQQLKNHVHGFCVQYSK